MRVVYSVSTKFAGAGIGYTAYHFVRGIYRAGWLEKAIVGYEAQHDIPRERVRSFPWMRFVARLARDYAPLRDTIFDVVASRALPACDIFHGWSHQCLYSLQRAKKFGAITFVERPNSHDLYQDRLLREEYERWGYRPPRQMRSWGIRRGLAEYQIADFITVPSSFAYQSMLEEGIPEERLFLTPYGVDTERFYPGTPPRDVFRLLFVGQVSLRKGVPYLLQAWQRLGLPQAELWLVGRITPDARHVVAPYRHHPSVRFLGHVADVAPLYRQASVFVLPSIEEGSALVTYEAMASGLPLIFTPNTGAVARDGVEGIQVPIRDVDALAAAIERLYREPELRIELGRAGRKRVLDYTWEKAGERLLRAYTEARRRLRPDLH